MGVSSVGLGVSFFTEDTGGCSGLGSGLDTSAEVDVVAGSGWLVSCCSAWGLPQAAQGYSPYAAESNTQPISCLINLWIFVKMGVAQVSCCVGGWVSCIGAWGAGTLHVLPFCCLWLYFTLYRLIVRAVFLNFFRAFCGALSFPFLR